MFKDLKWKPAFKKAAVFVVLWFVLIYVLDRVWPQQFGIKGQQGLFSLALNGVFFFFIFAFVFAFSEKRRADRVAKYKAQKTQKKGKGGKPVRTTDGDSEEDEPGSLRGRYNPNTSRKRTKARRRQTRR
ncbi:MAG: hypothetical protein ACR2GU_10415 [Rubrobacteraceae bacterium]